MNKEVELIGLVQASNEFNIPERTLRKAASDGILRANKVAGVWLVARIEVERYIKEDRRTVGRPASKKE